MPTYQQVAKTAHMTADRDLANGGSLEIGTSGMATIIATVPLAATSGSVSGSVWTLAFANATVSASASGTPAEARIKKSDGTVILSGLTVGTSGTDIVLTYPQGTSSVTAGQSITFGACTVTHS